MIHSTMNRRNVSINKKSKPRIRYFRFFDLNLTLNDLFYEFLFSKSSHKDDVWINPFIRPPICSIIIAVSISFIGACLLYLDRDQSIILSKQVSSCGLCSMKATLMLKNPQRGWISVAAYVFDSFISDTAMVIDIHWGWIVTATDIFRLVDILRRRNR